MLGLWLLSASPGIGLLLAPRDGSFDPSSILHGRYECYLGIQINRNDEALVNSLLSIQTHI
jgi:hypothetical protein